MSSQPVLNFRNLFKEENVEELHNKKFLQSGWISIFYDKEKRKIVTNKPVQSVIERIRYDEQNERSKEYLSRWLEEQERLKEEIIEDIGLDEYERLYKVYPSQDDEEELCEDEEFEEILEDNEDADYDDYYDK